MITAISLTPRCKSVQMQGQPISKIITLQKQCLADNLRYRCNEIRLDQVYVSVKIHTLWFRELVSMVIRSKLSERQPDDKVTNSGKNCRILTLSHFDLCIVAEVFVVRPNGALTSNLRGNYYTYPCFTHFLPVQPKHVFYLMLNYQPHRPVIRVQQSDDYLWIRRIRYLSIRIDKYNLYRNYFID